MSLKRKGAAKKILAAALTMTMLFGTIPVAPVASAKYSPGNPELARQVASEGMVLLQNKDNGLPIPQGGSVALFGQGQIDYVKGGWGSGDTSVDYLVNILQGMQNKEKEGKITLNKTLVDAYTANKELTLTADMANTAAAESDTAVVVISRNSGEGSDRSAGKGDYLLSDAESKMLDLICAAGFEHVAVVLNIGGIIDTKWITERPEIDSVLIGWQAGMEGGNAIADVLCGDVNPSGKLTDTWAKNYEDYPSSNNFSNNAYVNYEEDVFVGYRYFETFDKDYEKVNYPFGYGLSYTTFDMTDVKVTYDEENINVEATITNTGDVAGKEVAQVYFSAPQMGTGTAVLGKPAKELAAYAKTGLLEPDTSETLKMSFAIEDMSSYDDTGITGHKSAYVMEAGDYDIYVGNSIKNAGENGVRGAYTVEETYVTEQLSEQAAPKRLPKRLLADGSYEDMRSEVIKKISATEPTKVEAEDYESAHAGVRVESFSGGSCVAYMDSAEDHRWVSYSLNVEQAGTYAVQLHMSNGYAEIKDMVTVEVEGRDQKVVVNLPQTGDGSGKAEWYNFIDLEPFEVKLPKGPCTLKLTCKGTKYGNTDYMTFNMVQPEEGFAISATETSRVEAEQFFGAAGNVRIENCVPNHPLGYVPQPGDEEISTLAYMNYEGNWVTYYLNVEEEGVYDISFSMSNGRPEIPDMMRVYVDGKLQPGINFNLPQTGDGEGKSEWYNFETFGPIQVNLPKGLCEFKLVSTGLFGNIDYMDFSKAEAEEPAAAAFRASSAASSKAAGSRAASSAKAADDEPTDKIMLIDVYHGTATMDDFIAQLSNEDLAYLSQGHPGIATGIIGGLDEYGIPGAQTTDGPAGVRSGTATAWPCSTNLASTWDVELAQKVGKGVATEALEKKLDIWLAPGMNIHRNPLCGRNFEYYSEDPLLTGKTAAAITKGVQGEGVSITLKHFVANNKENNRNASDSRMSERALREIYLKGFEIAVREADPWCIMSSYNYVNGTEVSENYDILTNILRGEWGFKGMVMSDWGNDDVHWKEVRAGNDVKMPNGSSDSILTALENGDLTRAELERNIARTLEMIMKTPVMDREIVNPPQPEYVPISATEETTIKAIDYFKALGIGEEACEDEGGGTNPTHTDKGNWMKYYFDIEAPGTYDFYTRVAVNADGGFDLRLDGKSIGGVSSMAPTGGWQSWTTLEPFEITLPAGRHELQFYCTVTGFNVNWFKFVPKVLEDVSYTVNYVGRDASLLVNGEEQKFADNISRYDGTAKRGETVALSFIPRTDGKEFSKVLLNGEPVAIKDPTRFDYVYTADYQNNTLNFSYTLLNKSTLRTVLAIAEDCLTTDEYKEAIPAVQEALTDAIAAATVLLDNPDATQAELNDASFKLIDVIQMLSFKAGDKTYLNYLINISEEVDTEGSLPSDIEAFENALEAAKVVVADDNALEEEVKDAADALYDAMIALLDKVDKTYLNTVVVEAMAIAEEIEAGAFLPDNQEAFQTALAEAKKVVDDEEASQSEIKAAAKKLADAMAALRRVPNKKALETLIADVEKMDLSKYEASGVNALLSEIKAAKNYLDTDLDAEDQPEIDARAAKIDNLVDALVEKGKDNNSHGSSGGGSGNKGGSSGKVSGDGTAPVVPAAPVVTGGTTVAKTASVVSDTTLPFSIKRGAAYCFKMTVVNGSAAVPSFTVGNGNAFKTQFVAKIGNAYYFRIWAIGAPGQSTGVYTTMPNEAPQQHCVVTIA